MKYLICFATCFLLAGCATLFPIQVTDPRTGIEYTVPSRLHNVPGIRELAEACATQAGRVVHRTVEVEGYFDASLDRCDKACWRSFALSGFQYIEFKVESFESWDYLKESGHWRISREELDGASCHSRATEYLKKIAKRDGWEMGYCVALENVGSLRSSYSFQNSIEEIDLEDEFGSTLIEGTTVLVDLGSGESMAEQTSYTLYARYKKNWPAQQLGCNAVGIQNYSGRFFDSVIVPK